MQSPKVNWTEWNSKPQPTSSKSTTLPSFQIKIAKGPLEKTLATATLKFEIGDGTLAEHFVVMMKLTGPIIGFNFMRNSTVVNGPTHGFILFPHFRMQIKTAAIEKIAQPQVFLTGDALTIPLMTTKTFTAFRDHPWEWNAAGLVTPLAKFRDTTAWLIFHSTSTLIGKKTSVRVTNTTESPYSIKKKHKVAKFSLVIPEQSIFIKPVDTAILSMVPEADPDLTIYLNEVRRTSKPEN